MKSQRTNMEPKIIYFYYSFTILFIFSSILCVFGNYTPLQTSEWEINPDIFSEWPKGIVEDKKVQLKTLTRTHKYLPRTTEPVEYTVQLRTILDSDLAEEELTAPGTVQILIKCMEETDKIVLNADLKHLKILEASVKVSEATLTGLPSNNLLPVVNQTYEAENDFYNIHLASRCKLRRKYVIHIDFISDISVDDYVGLYLSEYTDPNTNVTKRLATTQFEDEHSRKMFPNYDNPDFKAVFTLIIGRPEYLNSMSNMNLIKTEKNNELPDWYWDHYARTPKMSSYLIALVVSDFTCVSAPPSLYKKIVKVCGPPYMIEKGGGKHSTGVVANILGYYDGFMKQNYPLPHMISVAIPDFRAGAMENWGINTYRIKGLIYYENKSSEAERFRIDLTIAHELAHQNFGNLVTCKLWSQIYLNEGFATYISYYGLNSSSPEYEPEKQWIAHYRRRALLIDAKSDSHPLVNVTDPSSYFDAISYSKGASLIRMMENFLTEAVLHKGLQSYLRTYAYDTATQWDLFDVLDHHAVASNVKPPVATVAQIMETWTLQKGFPLIRVDYLSNKMIALSQEQYFSEQEKDRNPFPTSWYIPIFKQTDRTKEAFVLEKRLPATWLTTNQLFDVLYIDDEFKWIIINPDGGVFARILYDEKLSELIVNLLTNSPTTLSAVTRAQIIEDMFENSWAGYCPLDRALNFTRYLSSEQESVVWSAALNGFGKIYSMIVEDDETLLLFKKYVGDRISAQLAMSGVEQRPDEKGMKVLHRSVMLAWGGTLQLPKVLQYGKKLVQEWETTGVNRVPPDLHSQTYCNAIIAGGRDTFESILDLFKTEVDNDIKGALANGLGCSTDVILLEELRRNVTNGNLGISKDLCYQIVIKLARNVFTRKSMLKFFNENFYEIREYFGGVKIFAWSFENAAPYWNTESHLQQLTHFVDSHKDEFAPIQKFIQRVFEEIRKNIKWMAQFGETTTSWLKQNQ